jgi:hypothetical protein
MKVSGKDLREGGGAMRRFRGILTVGVMVGMTAMSLAVPSAGAYGKTAQYQVTASFNCDSTAPHACDMFGGTGGFWAWYEFDNDGTGDETGTFCGHVVAGGAAGQAGAGHENVDIRSWDIEPAGPGALVPGDDFYILSDLTTFVGHGSPVTVPNQNVGDTGIPAAPGHYNLHLGPGITAQITIVKIPNR